MLRIATAGLCVVAALGLTGCVDPAVTPVARIGAPDRDAASPDGAEDVRAPATDEPEGLPLHATSVRGTGTAAPHSRAAGQDFGAHAVRLAREFRDVWVTGGAARPTTGDGFTITVTGEPSPALLARVARLPMDVEVLSGDLPTRRQYAALASDVRRGLGGAGVLDGVVVGVAPLGDALVVHAPVEPADTAPIATVLTRLAAALDARAATAPGRRAALRGAVPIRLYARSADGEVVPVGGVPAGPLPQDAGN